jgi:hypothetical protein
MNDLTIICCVCGSIKHQGAPGALISHTYCRICAASIIRQMNIDDMVADNQAAPTAQPYEENRHD